MQIIRAADHRRMSWKNGGGETLEVAVHPPGAGLADFTWRLSMALVTVDGPFSAFAGIDRTIVVLEGEGMALAVEGLPPRTLSPESPPWCFPGDAPTAARLTGGSIRDLNAMTRRGVATHEVERVELTQPLPVAARDGWVFALCAAGSFAPEGGPILSRYDVAVCGPGNNTVLQPGADPTTIFLIRFTLLDGQPLTS